MTTLEFQPFPKIARLNRNITITEKLDGTNAAVVIDQFHETERPDWDFRPGSNGPMVHGRYDGHTGTVTRVYAQSRTRFITPQNDNYGFAGWVQRNAEALVDTLGEGAHFGEWWGSGIQRKYGLTGNDKRFSLFNTSRWATREARNTIHNAAIPGLGVVPVLYEGPFDQDAIDEALSDLRAYGSPATRTNPMGYGFDRPEGIVIFHHASRELYKVTLEGDEAPKGAAGHALDEERRAA